jgi:8-oxo-dGTP pyrophosphatase MutT (NUDIX family)
VGNDYHFLFEQRSAGISQGSEICFPGGLYDDTKDQSLRETAIRETTEELGIEKQNITILGSLGTIIALRGIAVDCFLGILSISSIADLVIDTSEVERVFTLPVSWFEQHKPQQYQLYVEMQPSVVDREGNTTVLFPARQLGLPQQYWQSWQVNKRRVLVYPTDEGTVWGMTAWIVFELISRFYSDS